MSENSRASRPRSRILGRIAVTILMIASLCATASTREWAIQRHASATNHGHLASAANSGSEASALNAMPSFATALLLGGLRGPLVMILWTTSENQKQQHDLEDIDTKIEWIRLLQPEFDQVHLFQIWNKAYNISVMMADQSNKYTTVLDAIDYGQKVDQSRPDDINIIGSLAGIYDNKLGRSQEHPFYRYMVRKETQTRYRVSFPTAREKDFRDAAGKLGWTETTAGLIENKKTDRTSVLLERPLVSALRPNFTGDDISYDPETRHDVRGNNPGWRRLRLEPILDVNGNLFPDLLLARFPRPANWPADKEWYDGSQLEFLKKYEPFPYGISTLALGYNDYERCRLLQRDWSAKDIQNSESVVSSRPAIALKQWGMDEWERGRRAELRMRGGIVQSNIDPVDLELPLVAVPYATPTTDILDRDLALYSYKTGARVLGDARHDFEVHDNDFPYNAGTYRVHIDDTKIGEALLSADYDYLAAGSAGGADRQKLVDEAKAKYKLASERAAIAALKYCFDDQIAAKVYPMKNLNERYNRADIESSNQDRWIDVFTAAEKLAIAMSTDEDHQYHPGNDNYSEERDTYMHYLQRALQRLDVLNGKAPATIPTEIPQR